MNPYKDAEESSINSSVHISYEDIASKLLKDHHFLTALELHTELVESGKELPQLREFFSNPGNFEQHVTRATDFTSMHRTPSLATLDSLDTARYSEDGCGDRAGSGGEVAVLEFELRKAKETINALRANLTQFADGEPSLEKKFADNTQRTLKPHEKRALNFLINEYLLLQDYKLTSITFSDENPDQEFEDWDDVGLNMPRPDGLISLFWGGTSRMCPKVDASTETYISSYNVQCQTNLEETMSVCQESDVTDWSREVLLQAEEIQMLKQNIIALETEKLNFQKLYDEAIVTLNSLTSPASESRDLVLQLPEDRLKEENVDIDEIKIEKDLQDKPITYMASENHYGSGNSTHSATPDQFEMVYSDKNNIEVKKEKEEAHDPQFIDRGSPLRPGSVNTLESLSINDASEWTRVQYDYPTDTKETWIERNIIPNNLKEMLLNWRRENFIQDEPLANDLLLELINREKPIDINDLLPLVAETLPRILPHTLVGRRGEAAALLAAGAALAGGARPRLLHSLLTMYKKPDARDTQVICQAACLVVKWGGSGEVLSCVAELLASKTAERRLLASQVCLAIAPYVPLELCTSLFLSLVALMCESSEREIRAIGLCASCLVCPVAEHKYSQLESIMFNFFKDPFEKNVQNTVNVFLPIMARCALCSGKFHSELYKRILSNFSKSCEEGEWKNVVLYLDAMRVLVLAKLVYVANVPIVKEAGVCDTENTLQDVPLSETTNVTDLDSFLSLDMDVKQLMSAMNSLLKQKPKIRWPELDWMIDTFNQILEVTAKSKMLHHHTAYELLITLVNTYIEKGGASFTVAVLKPMFENIITVFESKLEKLDTISSDMFIIVGVYLATVLISTETPYKCDIFLQKWLVYCSSRALPVAVYAVPFKWLAKHKPEQLDTYMKNLKIFSESIGESLNVVSIRTYVADLTTELLNTATVTADCLLRHAAPLVLRLLDDADVGVREAAYMAWGRAWFECSSRANADEDIEKADSRGAELANKAQLLARKADALLKRTLSVREAAKLAHVFALLVTEQSQVDVAVSALGTLTGRVAGGVGAAGAAGGEVVAALSAALQLAALHAPAHPALLPAARKLEAIVQSPSLCQYKPTIDALLQRAGGGASASVTPSPRLDAASEVGRRVTQIFNAKAGNLQNMFKKKT
ncbi:RAB11-binding protein RELCH homolog [Aricia agestis]|uniref:RAB11-binding protein RELCH homolog n=1 Tax=Aricia agestis TaxID=91739 RepID=UPI001C20917E|nr:RAB11-binding protein RELCH homolog [Aricia agestis]